jgi:hypothetical protein
VRTSNPTNKEFVLRGVIKTPREATGVKNCWRGPEKLFNLAKTHSRTELRAEEWAGVIFNQ